MHLHMHMPINMHNMYMYMCVPSVAVDGSCTQVWFSPPCETYSTLALGTLCADRFGGPQRRGSEEAYAPVRGRRGATARRADRLVGRVFGWLHRHASRG